MFFAPLPKRPPVIALVDCNNFYCSCERIFQPRLAGKPMVVLSNNDGCVIARSNEAKALGIPMGAPFFQVRNLLKRAGGAYRSSNYALYGDISRRVMETLHRFAPEIEVYSIDEAFLQLSGVVPGNEAEGVTAYAQTMRETVRRWVGMPVSIGLAPTKTLAKLANRIAKKNPQYDNVLDWRQIDADAALESIEAGDVWGVGPRYAIRLQVQGIHNARQLRDADERWIQYRLGMGIVGVRIVYELRGTPCHPFECTPPPKQNIACTRQFGRAVTTLRELNEAVATYATRAAEKLRSQDYAAGELSVFIHTNPHKEEPQYYQHLSARFEVPTDVTTDLVRCAKALAERLYRPGYRYSKSGVILSRLIPRAQVQGSLFDRKDHGRDARLMAAVDHINRYMGAGAIQPAAVGTQGGWKLKSQFRSPRYTTQWSELPNVR